MSQATGAQVQTTVNGLAESALGTCAQFQEKQVSCPWGAPLLLGAQMFVPASTHYASVLVD